MCLEILIHCFLTHFSVSEIKSLTTAIEEATYSGPLLNQIFNSTDDRSSLKNHYDALGQVINEAAVSQLVIDYMVTEI